MAAAAQTTTSTCNSCVFFEDRTEATLGTCRANPPVPATEEKAAAVWPAVKTDDWCGQHTVGRH